MMIITETTRTEFVRAVARNLEARGVAFDATDVSMWLDQCWRSVEADPSPERWASEYLAVLGDEGGPP